MDNGYGPGVDVTPTESTCILAATRGGCSADTVDIFHSLAGQLLGPACRLVCRLPSGSPRQVIHPARPGVL